MAELAPGWSSPDNFEDEDREPSPEEIAAEQQEDAKDLYRELTNRLAEIIARRGYGDAIPLLRSMILEDPQALWSAAAADAYLYRED
jgi:hypothetical protein